MKIKLKNVTFNRATRELSKQVQLWIEAQDTPVTVRRAYYAMVKDKAIENTKAEYGKISRIILKLRQGGLLDWDLIIDNERSVYKNPSYDSALDCVTHSLEYFRLDRWKNCDYHVEVWCEKRGAVSAILQTTNALDVPLCPTGGRRALTEEAVLKMLEAQQEGKINVIIYLGDYDPSGCRMDENLQNQLSDWGLEPIWTRVGLTMRQIVDYQIEPAFIIWEPATKKWRLQHPDVEVKIIDGKNCVNKLEKDKSAKWFREQNNGELFQVEVDALDAKTLRKLVKKEVEKYLDVSKFQAVLDEEAEQREEMINLLQ